LLRSVDTKKSFRKENGTFDEFEVTINIHANNNKSD